MVKRVIRDQCQCGISCERRSQPVLNHRGGTSEIVVFEFSVTNRSPAPRSFRVTRNKHATRARSAAPSSQLFIPGIINTGINYRRARALVNASESAKSCYRHARNRLLREENRAPRSASKNQWPRCAELTKRRHCSRLSPRSFLREMGK